VRGGQRDYNKLAPTACNQSVTSYDLPRDLGRFLPIDQPVLRCPHADSALSLARRLQQVLLPEDCIPAFRITLLASQLSVIHPVWLLL
jgi:hypothetical protein